MRESDYEWTWREIEEGNLKREEIFFKKRERWEESKEKITHRGKEWEREKKPVWNKTH